MSGDILKVATETKDGFSIVRAKGEVDISSADLLHRHIAESERLRRTLIVDLSAVTFLDSTGLGVLIAAHRQIGASTDRAGLDLVVNSPQLLRILEVTGLSSLFRIHATLEGAMHR